MPEPKKTKKMSAAEFLAHLQATVAHFDLDEDQTKDYINQHMERAGFKPTVSWGDPEPSEGGSGGGSGWFPGS